MLRYAKEIAEANYPEIRHFWIPTLTDLQGPQDDLPTGYWKSANPQMMYDHFLQSLIFLQKKFMKNIMCRLV